MKFFLCCPQHIQMSSHYTLEIKISSKVDREVISMKLIRDFNLFSSLTTDRYVTELHGHCLVQCEAPGGFVFVPWVAAV